MNSKYKKVQEFYNKNAKEYSLKCDGLLVEQLDDFLSYLQTGSVILDVGCGTGKDTEYFSKKGFFSIGVDFSEEMVKLASKREVENGVFINEDILNLNKSSDCFNAAWVSSVFTHFLNKDTKRLLDMLRTMVLKGGYIGVILKKKVSQKKNNNILFQSFNKNDILSLVKDTCFSIIKTKMFVEQENRWYYVLLKNNKFSLREK